MDTTTEAVTDEVAQVLLLQELIIMDYTLAAYFWHGQGREDREQYYLQLAENAAQVLRGIEATGDVNYCPF